MAKVRVVAGCDEEQHEVGAAHDPVPAGEQQRRGVESLRHAQRDHEQSRHCGEDREPDDFLLGVDDAGEPRIANPCPPHHAEHEQALGESLPRGLVRHQRGALRERQNEDEVEEELERSDPLSLPHGRRQAGRTG